MRELEHYLDVVAGKLERCTKYSGKFLFRCNICKDSQKDKRKRRAYLLKKEGDWFFYCHNCSNSFKAVTWLKKYFPELYREYVYETFNSSKETKENFNTVKQNIVIEKELSKKEYYQDCKFVPITSEADSQLLRDARKVCSDRKIFYDVWKTFFVCTAGKLRWRIIIPFYNKQNKIEYFTARKIYDQVDGQKYLNMIGDKKIYNIDFVNKEKPIVVVEGPIDSSFIINSIAILGTHGNRNMDNELNKLKCFYLFDNDDAGKEKSREYLKLGKFVFNWKQYLSDNNLVYNSIKDINNLFLQMAKSTRFCFEELDKYFSNNPMDNIYFI
jgi:hypothetical protein